MVVLKIMLLVLSLLITLIFAHVVFRQGDKNPDFTYPTDPWKDETNWPGGFGQLTEVGMRQAYEFGQHLRERYHSLLGDGSYSKDVIYAKSTDFDPTLMTAQAVLAGMFPPKGDQIWNNEILWRPIPVHTVPRELERLFHDKRRCPLFYYLLNEYMKSPKAIEQYAKYSQLFQYLEDHTGLPIENVTQAGELHDILWIEQLKNKTLPEWATSILWPGSDFEELALLRFKSITFTPEIARLSIGFLIRDILNRCSQKLMKTLSPDRSIWLYSAHDMTIASILNSFGRYQLHKPSYVSSLHFELYKTGDSNFLQVSYRNSSGETLIKFPVCSKCSIEDIRRIHLKILPLDEELFEEECRLPMHIRHSNKLIAMGIIVSILPVIFLAVYMLFFRNRSFSRDDSNSEK